MLARRYVQQRQKKDKTQRKYVYYSIVYNLNTIEKTMKVSFKVLFLSVILMQQVKVIYGEEKSSSSEEDDQITTTVQPEAIPEDNVQENSVVSSNNNNKTKTSSTSLPSLIGNIVTHLGKKRIFFLILVTLFF